MNYCQNYFLYFNYSHYLFNYYYINILIFLIEDKIGIFLFCCWGWGMGEWSFSEMGDSFMSPLGNQSLISHS